MFLELDGQNSSHFGCLCGALVQKITKSESWMAGGLFSSKAGFSRSQFFVQPGLSLKKNR